MIENISKWAEGIIVAMILVTIIENILPNGSIKKYIKIILGFFVVLVVISPLTKKISLAQFDLNSFLDSYNTKNYNEDEIKNKYEKNVLNTLVDNIEDEVTQKIIEKGYDVKDIMVTILNNTYSIKDIKLCIDKRQKDNNIINIIEIDKVNISSDNNKKNNISDEEIKSLKDFLSTTYCLDKNKILINNK